MDQTIYLKVEVELIPSWWLNDWNLVVIGVGVRLRFDDRTHSSGSSFFHEFTFDPIVDQNLE